MCTYICFQKLQYDSDTSEKVASDGVPEESEPKIAIKTRHPSGENNQEPSRVVESKRRSFIVSRVVEHSVIPDKIQEDESEAGGTVSTETAMSPENTQHTAPSGTNSLIHSVSQQIDTDTAAASDSMKSVGKASSVPVNINDLNNKLAKLTGGTIGQLEVTTAGSNVQATNLSTESYSPVPSDDSVAQQPQHQTSQPQFPLPEVQLQEQSASHQQTHQSQQAQNVEKTSQPSAPTTQLPQHSVQLPTSQQPVPASIASSQATVQTSQTIPPSTIQHGIHHMHPQSHQAGVPLQNMPLPTHSQPQTQQQQHAPVQNQSSQDLPHQVYPGGMPFLPMMQPYSYPHQHGVGMMPPFNDPMHMQSYGDPMHYMNLQFGNFQNQMVPYVMVNVQQQQQIAPMLVPANMIMHAQMPFMNPQTAPHQSHTHSDGHSGEQTSSSPPGTPPQQRKQLSTDAMSESGMSEAQSPAPPRSNYSIASLEQELIKKLHGNRKDIPLSSAGLSDSFNQGGSESGTRLPEDRPHWTQSSESLHSGFSETTDQSEGLGRVDEADSVTGDSVGKTDDISESKDSQPDVKVVKRLRFQVSRVEEDPLRSIPENDLKHGSEDQVDSSDQVDGTSTKTPESDTTNVKNEKVAKLGRFSVTKIDDGTQKPGLSTDESKENFDVSNDIADSKNEDQSNKENLDETLVPDELQHDATGLGNKQDTTSVSRLHDLPYRKKSMSFFEGNDSPVLSNNTCDSFYNSHLDRYQIASRRRTKSLGSLPVELRRTESSQSTSMQTQFTQYGDGETPSPSPSPRDPDGGFPHVVFDLMSNKDSDESMSSDSENGSGNEDGNTLRYQKLLHRRRKNLHRQSRKVSAWCHKMKYNHGM